MLTVEERINKMKDKKKNKNKDKDKAKMFTAKVYNKK